MLGNGHDTGEREPRKAADCPKHAPRRGRPQGTTAEGSLREARRQKEWALCGLRQLEFRKRKGELHEAAECLQDRIEENRRVRNALLAVPSRVRARLPHLTAQDIAVIDEEIRNALTVLSEDEDGAP